MIDLHTSGRVFVDMSVKIEIHNTITKRSTQNENTKNSFIGSQRGERVSRYGCEGTIVHLACPEGHLLQVHPDFCFYPFFFYYKEVTYFRLISTFVYIFLFFGFCLTFTSCKRLKIRFCLILGGQGKLWTIFS